LPLERGDLLRPNSHGDTYCLIANIPVLVQNSADAESCRPNDTRGYGIQQYQQLMDILAYDRGPEALNSQIMKEKLERLVASAEYHSLKALFKDCAPTSMSRIFSALIRMNVAPSGPR
jgi:hypothetical protein